MTGYEPATIMLENVETNSERAFSDTKDTSWLEFGYESVNVMLTCSFMSAPISSIVPIKSLLPFKVATWRTDKPANKKIALSFRES